jgi:Na+/H+ antiporter NhaD/arsenite permease-like protein|tara:strand:+ start:834 stop:1055 length:222 start_codon:yes stop_codon:yes gene_type:complete
MYNFISTIRFTAVFLFILWMIYLFAKFLLIPILIFALVMKLLGYFKFNKIKNKKSNKKHNEQNFIDAEYEDLD